MSKKSIIFLIVFFLAAAGAIFAIRLLNFKKSAEQSLTTLPNILKEAANQILNFQFEEARQSFTIVNKEVTDLNEEASALRLDHFSQIRDGLGGLIDATKQAVAISSRLSEIKNQAFGWIVNKQGERLIKSLSELREDLRSLSAASRQLGSLGATRLPDEYSNLGTNLADGDRFLAALIGWLRQSKEQHLAILFQNPSEIRPAGGFLGSFADLTLRRGSLMNLEVRDIYDIDGQLEEKIVPPKPLQLITARWGARDANWFFDFPTSARKVIQFLGASKIYQEREINFAGVLALNINVIRDILSVIGPVELKDYELTVDAYNFLPELQREVEAGEDKSAGQPKRILRVLAPIIFEKLGVLNEPQKQELAKLLKQRISQKDIMIYFRDSAIESYFQTLGVGGEIYGLPEDFWGNYLAVVNANVGGAKSDAFVNQQIVLETEITANGRSINHLKISRRHDGNQREEWWYRKSNRNWFQIYLEPEADLRNIKGNERRVVRPPVDYAALNYHLDADLQKVEGGATILSNFRLVERRLFGKKVFSGWLTVEAGESKDLIIDYETAPKVPFKIGQPYQLIFEKQSGVSGSFGLVLKAPPGYVWQENSSRVFRYFAEDPPGRLILTATLKEKQPF